LVRGRKDTKFLLKGTGESILTHPSEAKNPTKEPFCSKHLGGTYYDKGKLTLVIELYFIKSPVFKNDRLNGKGTVSGSV